MAEPQQRRKMATAILKDSHFLVPFFVLLTGIFLLAILH